MLVKLHETVSGAEISTVIFDRGYDLEEVIETYRRLNVEGTPHSTEDLEKALKALNYK